MIQVLRKTLGKVQLGLWGVFLAQLYNTAPHTAAPGGQEGWVTHLVCRARTGEQGWGSGVATQDLATSQNYTLKGYTS